MCFWKEYLVSGVCGCWFVESSVEFHGNNCINTATVAWGVFSSCLHLTPSPPDIQIHMDVCGQFLVLPLVRQIFILLWLRIVVEN